MPAAHEDGSGMYARAFASVLQFIADFYYRLADMMVALTIFGMLLILTLLPLHKIQSMLLFNKNFWRVTMRSARRSDILEKLIA